MMRCPICNKDSPTCNKHSYHSLDNKYAIWIGSFALTSSRHLQNSTEIYSLLLSAAKYTCLYQDNKFHPPKDGLDLLKRIIKLKALL